MSRNLIKKLLKNYMNRDILADEAKVDFNSNKGSSPNHSPYGPPPAAAFNHHGGFHGPSIANQ